MKEDYYVLGIGMSAGGLQSVTEFFGAVNGRLPLVIILASHLQQDSHAKLFEILSDKTSMDVKLLAADTEMQKGTIYVVGAGLEAAVEQNTLRVTEAEPDSYTINTLFHSLAVHLAKRAIGMILSGTGKDGAEGLKAISEAGGRVLVQEPFSALYQSLPRLAIKIDHPDKVLPPVRLAGWINKSLAIVK